MKSAAVQYTDQDGWSAPFPALDGPMTLVTLFSSENTQAVTSRVGEVRAAYPTSVIVGCSTAGEIVGSRVAEDTTVVGVMAFDATPLVSVVRRISESDTSRAVGRSIGAALPADGLRGVLVLSEGLNVNGSELSAGLASAIDPSVIVSGGLAGDGDRFDETWVLADDVPAANQVAVVGLYGDNVVMRSGHRGGWSIFGPERRVTKSVANVVYELDGMPALDLYERYLGDLAAELPSSGLLYPLAVWDDGADEQMVRTLLAVDREERSLTFAGNVDEGMWAQLMQASIRGLVEGATTAVEGAGEIDSTDVACIAISCVGRRLVMGAQVERETEATLDALPPGATQVGFYSYGEISPSGLTNCALHNQTMTVTVLAER